MSKNLVNSINLSLDTEIASFEPIVKANNRKNPSHSAGQYTRMHDRDLRQEKAVRRSYPRIPVESETIEIQTVSIDKISRDIVQKMGDTIYGAPTLE